MNIILKNKTFKLHLLILFITIFYGVAFIFSEFYASPVDNLKDIFILFSHGVIICFATYGLIYLLILNRYIFCISFPVLTLLCTLLTYYKYAANIALTPMIIELAFINDIRTCLDIFNWKLVCYLIVSLLFSVSLVYYRWKYIYIEKIYIQSVIAILILLLTNSWISAFSRPVSERMPFSIFYNAKKYLNEKRIVSMQRDTFTDDRPICFSDSSVVVLILGESLRSDHLTLNGYHRQTTPHLQKESNIISFPNLYTEPCFTHTSIPHILTRADKLHPERAYNEQSFISLFNQAGFKTGWIANQEPVDTYVYFMNECDTLIYANRGQSLYRYDKWLDEDILPFYRDELKNDHPNKLFILHTIGSHWWYNSHYTDAFEQYIPVVKSRVISSCTPEEMINSYDNTILYTDYFINQVINELRSKNAILIYISDHGETLGEDGLFLHGKDHPTLHNSACFIWYSELFESLNPAKIKNLKENSEATVLTDVIFHTILDAGAVQTTFMDSTLSLFNSDLLIHTDSVINGKK